MGKGASNDPRRELQQGKMPQLWRDYLSVVSSEQWGSTHLGGTTFACAH